MTQSLPSAQSPRHPVPGASTVYIAPGHSQCRVYLLPYGLRPQQTPEDIHPKYRTQWSEIGLLNFELKLVCIEPAYAHLKPDIEGQMGGTYLRLVDGLPAYP